MRNSFGIEFESRATKYNFFPIYFHSFHQQKQRVQLVCGFCAFSVLFLLIQCKMGRSIDRYDIGIMLPVEYACLPLCGLC